MYLRTIGRRFTKMIAYFLVMNSKSISSPFCFKELPAENKWIWAKWPVWIRLTEKIASIKRTTQACLFFFFPFYSCFTNSLQLSSEAMKYTKLFYSRSDPTIQCSLFYEKNTPLWSQQISFLSDYEATREARMLQAPITCKAQ